MDILLKDKELKDNHVVKEKIITGFFSSLDVEGLGEGNVKRIIAAGFDTIPKIIAMTEKDFLTVEGFKQKMAQKISSSICAKMKEVTLPELMHATNIFGRGFGTKKLASILNELPTILLSSHEKNEKQEKQEKIKTVSNIPGMAKKTAERFVENINEFVEFIKSANLTDKLNYHKTTATSNIDMDILNHPFYQKKYVMTGFRDKELIAKLESVGAQQVSSVSKNTYMVIVKNLDEDTVKVQEAKKLNVKIMTPEMLMGGFTPQAPM